MLFVYHLILRQETRRLMILFCNFQDFGEKNCCPFKACQPFRGGFSHITAGEFRFLNSRQNKKITQRHLPQNTIGNRESLRHPVQCTIHKYSILYLRQKVKDYFRFFSNKIKKVSVRTHHSARHARTDRYCYLIDILNILRNCDNTGSVIC